MRRLYLSDCVAGDLVEDVYVLTGKQFAPTSTGKHYIKTFVSDRSSQVTARMWNATRELFAAMPDGGVARIRGRIENYQNNLQCIIEQIWPAKEGSFDIGDLLPRTTKDINQMVARIFEILSSLRNRHLSALVGAYLDDDKLMADFCRAPAAMTFHHAYIGGLLEHTLNAIEVADVICPFYPGLNRDLVVTGIFLHDLAKTWELSYECAFGYTDGGQLVGHIVKSAMWVEHKAKEAERRGAAPIPQALIDVVQHIILSHHGEAQFGAAKPPSTPEALAVHIIENMDAKLMMSLTAAKETRDADAAAAAGAGPTDGIDKPAGGGGNWTEYMKAFNGRLYKPDVALPDDGSPSHLTGERQTSSPTAPPSAAAAEPEAGGTEAGALRITNPLFAPSPPKRN